MEDFNKRYLEFCKPFIDAIKDVYSTMMMTELTAGAPQIKKNSTSFGEFNSIMGISGSYSPKIAAEAGAKHFQGNLVLSWPTECFYKSAGAMLMEEYTEYHEDMADVGMEICNITMGNAKKVLTPMGYAIEMSIPTSIRGEQIELKVQEGIVTISTPMESALGVFNVDLSYKDVDL